MKEGEKAMMRGDGQLNKVKTGIITQSKNSTAITQT